MGSGKSTIAKLLSEKLQIPCLDLDKIIEKNCEMTVSEIFKEKGEIYFRKLERELFLELMDSNETSILSLGGGTPCYSNNHELLKTDKAVSFYLKASIETLFNRLSKKKMKRPIIANMNDDELKEFIAKHLFERSFYYNQVDYVIDIDNKSAKKIGKEIRSKLT